MPFEMEDINLARNIEERLPQPVLAVIKKAEGLARSHGNRLYLVGGVVRDLLLEKQPGDIDLVLEGDAIMLAQELAQETGAKVTVHQPFMTARLAHPQFTLDLTTARRESYARPGALPEVHPGSLRDDLLRRDFSINAMAVSLNTSDYGELIDKLGGLADLNGRLVRVLHDRSFTDDATRIWRALRYEQRLDFCLEERTLQLLERDLPMLRSVSGDRIWYELECAFAEELPENVFARAAALGVLAYLHPGLGENGWLAAWFDRARRLSLPQKPSAGLYLALLTYNLDMAASQQVADYLKLNKRLTHILLDNQKIRAAIEVLDENVMQPSAIYQVLHGCSDEAVTANMIACGSVEASRNLEQYLNELRYVKPILDGNDLLEMGVPQGPLVKAALHILLEARLDGEVRTREDEDRLVKLEILND